ncbi:MAG: hypothetical protein M3245_01595 [Actinomycetota bacterium]|nr:hypothetical protein [Actinomycetota bacterium]
MAVHPIAGSLLLAVLGGCTQGSPAAGEVPPIDCMVTSRPAPTEGTGPVQTISLRARGDEGRYAEHDFRFEARLMGDVDVGHPSPDLVIGVRGGGVDSYHALYQIELGQRVENQFAGGHGFTGLQYVRSDGESAGPGDDPELQYWCVAV